MKKIRRKKGFFSISAVADMFSVHQQTIRLYEKQGLINPKRTAGGTRLFSEEDINKLEDIIYLTHQLGINIAGVEMVLKLKKKMKKMQDEMNKLFANTQNELDKQEEITKKAIQSSAKQLMQIKQQGKKTQSEDSSTVDIENWEIEYDE